MAALSDEQVMLRDMAREWVDNESPVAAFRKLRAAAAGGEAVVGSWPIQAEMGWAGVIVPEAHGGSAFGYLSLALVLEQLGRNLVVSPLASTAAAASAIMLGGSDEQKAAWLPRIASGEVVATLAIDEGPTFHPAAISARVEDGRLNGTKNFVHDGGGAGLFVVAAREAGSLALFLADGADPGITRSARRMIDNRDHAEIAFVDVAVTALEAGGKGLFDAVTDRAAACVCAEMLGLATQAFETTNDYLKTRVQFGQTLASFQALQHRMARMFTELELMRSVVEGAFEAIDAGGDTAQAVSLAKAVCGDTCKLVSREMVQLHGGIGMTEEHDAGLYLKRAAMLDPMWGNAAFHRERFARLNGY